MNKLSNGKRIQVIIVGISHYCHHHWSVKLSGVNFTKSSVTFLFTTGKSSDFTIRCLLNKPSIAGYVSDTKTISALHNAVYSCNFKSL